MLKKFLAIAAVLVITVLAWAGGDVWKSKPFSQWTEKDVADILQNSPWARANVQAMGAWRPEGMTQASGSGAVAGSGQDMSKNSAGRTPDQMGGTEKNAAAAAEQASYSIFWWSSRTIRAASMRRAVLKGAMKEADAEKTLANTPDEYMVLVQAANMQLFQIRGEDAFMKEAWLQMKKSKDKVFPTKVGFLKAAESTTVNGAVFYFPKKGANNEPTIASDEKEVDFYLKIGGAKLLVNFDPRKMVDSQGQDL